MRSTAIDRRSFLRLGAAGLAAAAFPRALSAAAAERELFVAAAANPNGGFLALLIDETGKTLASAPIATRGHDAAADPVRRRAVLFARRPGKFAVVIDAGGAAPTLFAPPDDRVFNGHGAFSSDGALLYASENDPAGNGRLGIYDTNGFSRIGELPTLGVGPHEVIVSPDGRRLIVANGGIATDPDVGAGRQNLNLDSMRPSLVELDRESGAVLNRVELDSGLYQLSIRHLAVDHTGAVWFGCQWEGDPVEHPPLVGRLKGDAAPMLVELPQRTLFRARNYVGAVAASRDGRTIAASCPRGGAILTFDAATGRLAGETMLRDSSGVAGSEDGFIATSGEGRVVRFAEGDTHDLSASDLKYDNHIRRL